MNLTQEGGGGRQEEDRCPESDVLHHPIHPSAGKNLAGLTVEQTCSPEHKLQLRGGQFEDRETETATDDDRSGGGQRDDEGWYTTVQDTMVSGGGLDVEKKNQMFSKNLAGGRTEPSMENIGQQPGNYDIMSKINILDAVVPEPPPGRDDERICLVDTTPTPGHE